MKNKKYYIALNDREYAEIISSLINKRNSLIRLGKYTDGVDEVIMNQLSYFENYILRGRSFRNHRIKCGCSWRFDKS